MFHQANVIPTDLPDGSGQSLLAYWYQQVMEELTSYLAFPVTVGIYLWLVLGWGLIS